MRVLMLILASALSVFCATTAFAYDFKPVQYGFLPRLTLDRDPAVCGLFLDAATGAFKSTRPINLYGANWPGLEMEWVLPVPPSPWNKIKAHAFPLEPGQGSPSADQANLVAVQADVEHDYNNEVLVLADWGSYPYPRRFALVLYRSREEFDWALTAVHTFDAVFRRALDLAPPSVSAGFAGKSAITASSEQLSVLRIGWSFYVLSQGTAHDHGIFALSRIRSDRPPERICEIQALSDPAGYSLGPLKATPVDELLGLLLQISGQPVSPESEDPGHRYTLARAAEFRSQMVDRPWTMSWLWSRDAKTMTAWFTAWGEASLANQRLVRTLVNTIPAATATLRDFYMRAYALDRAAAAEAADAAISILISSHFDFLDRARPSSVVGQLERKLLQGAQPQEIERLLRAGAPLATHYTVVRHQEEDWPVREHVATEPTLFYALEVPANVSVLLAAGADPNVKGNFDKTALMYAAQFDITETARVLLDRGAEVNAVTDANGATDEIIVHDRRTPLMYAAENASRATIELLLARAADPTAKDSTGRDVLNYLGRNTLLTPAERSAVAQEVEAAADRFKP